MRSYVSSARRSTYRRSAAQRVRAPRGQLAQNRWIARLGPPFLATLIVAVAAITFPAPSDANRAHSSAGCELVPDAAQSAGKRPVEAVVRPLINDRGEQTGRRIELTTRRGVPVALTLDSDSFVGAAVADRLVYGQRTAGGSEVRALDFDSGCSVRLAAREDVVRNALLDASGESLYMHTVTAAARNDGGVTRLDITAGTSEQVLEPLVPDADLRPIYATQLAWAPGGGGLIVQSCGFEACLTRVLDVATDAVNTYDAEHGALVGMTAHDLVVFSAEHGRPAALLAIDLGTGIPRVIAETVYDAQLGTEPDSPLLIETPAGWQEVTP